ncbi:efflux transporter periplasmic adaptor subunit [Vibrio splendidus]|uniref:Efflux RND transporter periplasmic adaptor subunit n=1 Tax=Vibrio lentus TaxID=136468 RepID=A0A4U2B1U8_9VIBR|nr:efflux RND transporter periplasmic adaptor subunit [Vibrio lentus]PHN84717.1 efflux transporter periplasmic adaptor subunit [Vibrio splendidus]MCC4783613.1 efflux RND transporter periplasmic adaptor subunit [Vibrio lentus]PME64064.1 efflux transporter periplasmic adaptor subunit [Vibrio lentus]PMG63385.1 efflux transporter periplasmic adaptor subunit [Vibrio lentus]PMI93385.1 efflux transporter periplasmic adaptor subunit [Vibrio lentus]
MKLNTITIAITLVAGSSIFAALAYNGSQVAPAPEKANELTVSEPQAKVVDTNSIETTTLPAASQQQQVSVVLATLGNYQAEVVGYGEAKSRYELMFSTEVGGRVETISSQFETGQVISQGEVIANIDSTSYQQAVTQAKANVAQAQLDLLEEQRQGEQAKSEWQRSGLSGEPDSPLVLREPQLAQVTAALENAKLELVKAQQDLEKTTLVAPFDSLVVSRDVQPGSYAQTGAQIATLYSIDEVEVYVPLSENQWLSLPNSDNTQLKEQPWPVTLSSSDGQYQWQGYVERVEQHLQQDTRQRSLIVKVDNPLEQEKDLYPGTFVQATISGKQLTQLWELPASALSQQGDLWFVDHNSQLSKSNANVEFEKGGLIYIDPSKLNVEIGDSVQVVKRPLSSFKAGMVVLAKAEG